jgi:hypothetical protein
MKPKKVDDAFLAFPASVKHLIPPEAYDGKLQSDAMNGNTKWSPFFKDFFFNGMTDLDLKSKPGIDGLMAARHVMAIAKSFEPKHEVKEAAVSFLMDSWFEFGSWKEKDGKTKGIKADANRS